MSGDPRIVDERGSAEQRPDPVNDRKSWLEFLRRRFYFSEVGLFAEGLAPVRGYDGKCFHILADGTPAYTQRYQSVTDFQEGRAAAEENGQWFHIRLDGTPAYPKRYANVCGFKDGRAFVEVDDPSSGGTRWLCIDCDGKEVR